MDVILYIHIYTYDEIDHIDCKATVIALALVEYHVEQESEERWLVQLNFVRLTCVRW